MRTRVYGPGVDDIVMESVPSETEHYYYYHDALGNVVAVTLDTAFMYERYEYDAYGAHFRVYCGDSAENYRAGESYQWDPQVLFNGREYDRETGLYYYRARYYNPDIGRFLQTDPIGYYDSLNLYQYCGNNPVNWTDPWGMAVGEPGLAEGLIPIWGSGRTAINDFQTGHPVWGTINGAMAVLDVFGAGELIDGGLKLAKVGVKACLREGGEAAGKGVGEGLVEAAAKDGAADATKGAAKAVQEGHHLLPNQYAKRFKDAGLNVDDYVIDLSKAKHRLKPDGIHAGPFEDSWNGAWKKFFDEQAAAGVPQPRKEQILEQLEKMRKDFGI